MLIIDFVKNKANDGIYFGRRELENKLKISIRTYFKDLKELYEKADIDFSLVKKDIENKMLLPHTYKIDELEKQRNLIKEFIQENVSRSVYPSVIYIQKSLNLAFYNLYNNIFEAYADAEVDYERPSPIILGRKKEILLTKIVKELLTKMGFKIIRVSIESVEDFNRYADITIEDKNGIKYLVEVKAYREDYGITKREFAQLLRYMKKEDISQGIFITTSNTKKCNFENINFINGNALIELLKIHKLIDYLDQIEWIQKARVNLKEREEYKNTVRNKILLYITYTDNLATKKEIEKKFRVDIRTYFGEGAPYEKLVAEAKKLSALSP